MGAVQQSFGGDAGQQPGAFGDFGDIGLAEEDGLLHVQAQGNPAGSHFVNQRLQFLAVRRGGEGVQVRDKIHAQVFLGEGKGGAVHAEVVADVRVAGRLDAGQ